MIRNAAGLLAAILLAGPGIPRAPAAPAAKESPLALESEFVSRDVRIHVRGSADLPDGARLTVRCQRLEKGKPSAVGAWQLTAEVKDKRFELSRLCSRASFHPGRYAVEVFFAERQAEGLGVVTEAQKRIRYAGTLDLGGDQALLWNLMDLARPIAVGFREAPAQAEAAGRLEKVLGRKDLPFYLPSATLLLPLVGRFRGAAAPPASAPPTAPPPAADPPPPGADAKGAAPTDEEVVRALRPVALEGVEIFSVALNAILECYEVRDSDKVRTVHVAEDRRAAVGQEATRFVSSWEAYKTLPWQEALPGSVRGLMETLVQDVKVLPSARSSSSAAPEKPAEREKARGAREEKAPSLEALITRLREQQSRLLQCLAQEGAGAR